jgi:hypothetical protein
MPAEHSLVHLPQGKPVILSVRACILIVTWIYWIFQVIFNIQKRLEPSKIVFRVSLPHVRVLGRDYSNNSILSTSSTWG